MRKIVSSFTVFVFLLSFFGVTLAQAGGMQNQLTHFQGQQLPNVFTFEQLGFSEKMMVGPFDSDGLSFSLPANIKIAPGSSLTLKYALAWSGSGVSEDSQGAGVGGTLLVYFNGELIDTIILSSESSLEKEVAIPAEALNKVDENGRSSVRFFLNAEVNCEFNDVHTTVIISKSSLLNLQYEVGAPPVDLTLFPQPIYQPDAILKSSTLVVIPDSPDSFELQAALAIMAGLGAVSNGTLNANLATNGSLTQDMVASNHLIFVGIAKKFPNLQVVNFPIAVSGSGLALEKNNEDSGLIQVALSPWSQASIVMFIGGNSEEGVLRASQAFSTGKLVAVEKPDVSLISSVNPVENAPILEDQTFQGLGYEDQTLGLYDENYFAYDFYASAEQAVSSGAYLDLILSHSDLLDFDQTGVTVLLNDQVIGGIQVAQESPFTKRINLVPGVLRRGINRLEIVSDILPRFSCYSSDLLSTWITISNTSAIHLPVSENKLEVGANFNLRDFPYMFLDSRDMSDVAFILAPNDSVSWNNAARVAMYLGEKGGLPLVNLHAWFADNIPDDSLKDYSFLVFGRASTLPFMQKINDLLPAPFEIKTDQAIQPSMLVNYSLLPNTSVGYLQLLPSPWNSEHAILTISGNTLDGIPMAGATLIKDDLVARLSGNFAVLYEDQVVSTDTRLGVSKESIISQLPVVATVTPAVESSVSSPETLPIETRPAWIPPLIGVVTFGILVLIIVMMRREASAKKKPKEKVREESSSDSSSKPS